MQRIRIAQRGDLHYPDLADDLGADQDGLGPEKIRLIARSSSPVC